MAVALPQLNLQCDHCQNNPAMQIENGCTADSPIPDRWEVSGYKLQRCPGSIVSLQSYDYIKAYNWKEKGFLPNPGGWMEQPAKFIQAMDIIQRQIQLAEEGRIEDIKRKRGAV